MAAKPKTIDDYLSGLSSDRQAALQRLREIILVAASEAQERISCQVPAFRLNGMLVGFAAHANHCALCARTSTTIAAFAEELRSFDTSRGTIRFTPDKPLPNDIVRHLVEAKVAKNAERAKSRNSGGLSSIRAGKVQARVARR